MRRLWHYFFGVVLACATCASAQDNAAMQILERRCFNCHGATAMSGLDLRDRSHALAGGKRGPGIVSGDPQASLLYQAVAHLGGLRMPPGAKIPLPEAELAVLRNWIAAGARWPAEGVRREAARSSWWSFQPVRRPAGPAAGIDTLIAAKLAEKKLKPAPKADKRTLIRRAYFDLIGLPPSPDRVEAFLRDDRPDAFARIVDELLASPQYGERWARHWLDVVRYADSAGFEGDVFYPNAWRYRDYVIKSLNEDKPYDRFVQEQIAGDELWPDNLDLQGFYDVPPEKLEHLEARIGTTLYTFGPEIQESFLDSAKLRYERLTDWADTTGSVFLGLTVGCARCHDHKFDPLPQRDYFRLQAIFAPSVPATIPVVTGLSGTHRDEAYHTMLAIDEARTAYRLLERQVRDRVMAQKKKEFPPAAVLAFEVPSEKRTAEQAELAAPLARAYGEIKIEESLTAEERTRSQGLEKRIVQAVLDVPTTDGSHRVRFDGFFDLPGATVLGHVDPQNVPDVFVLNRGDLGRNRERVTAGLPSALLSDADAKDLSVEPGGPRYRKHLALWLTKPDHPLTARVMANRIWQGHFGRGIVATPNDFGRQGSAPSHPELLDWLASEFIARNWSIKSMHRLIMLSETYQRATQFTSEANHQADPENVYLWRMSRRRLEAEAVWDSLHAASGTLNLKMGGRPVAPPLSEAELMPLRIKSAWVTPGDPEDANRRAIYIVARRNYTFPMFDRFDRPESSASCPARDVTTVAPQALWSLNNQTSHQQAQAFAARLAREAGDRPEDQVRLAWRLALSREATAEEVHEALALIAKLGGDRQQALGQLCLAIFGLNEFVYVD